MPHLPAAPWTGGRQLGLVIVEVSLGVAAGEAKCDPIAQRLASFLA
jgi:hypothetical protein